MRTEDVNSLDLDLLRMKYRHGDGFTIPGAEKHYPPDLELEPIHLDIDLFVDLPAETASGTVTMTVTARRDGPTQLTLNAVAFEDLSVRDGDGRALTWQYDGTEIIIEWDEPFARSETRRAEVTYRVERPSSGLYFSQGSDEYPDAPLFAITDHETERARHWLPCIDLPNARPMLDFHLRTASQLTVLANGALIGETEHDDGTKTAHWRLDFPCPSYLTCFAIGDFVRADDGEHDGKPIAYFAPSNFTEDDLRRSFGRTGEMLDWMTKKLDMPLPFPKYFQVAVTGVGGAMENISLVAWDDVFVMDETLAKEWTRLLDEINVHEMAHSYFGDAVVCRDYAHAWLKESWATYIEQVWFKETHGRDEQLYQYYRDAHGYFAEADGRYQRPIVTREFNSSWDMYDGHLYPGGACRLHTLCEELGETTFWAAVRDYLKRYQGQVVETDDFRHVLESHSGRALGKQFDQWFHSSGYPDIKVAFKYDAKRQEGTFVITQKQVKPAGKDKGDSKEAADDGPPTFELVTDVGWTIDGVADTYPVKITEAKHTVIVPMAEAPEQVRFDPLIKVLHKLDFNPGDEMLRKQLTSAPDVIGRILAAKELAKTGKRKNIEAIGAAYRDEQFWGVRAQWANALGRAGVEAAIEVLADLVGWEEDPMVLETVIRAAGSYRDPRITSAIEKRLDGGMQLYRAQSASYEALGAQRDNAPFDRIATAAMADGWGGHVQSGALRSLAATRQDEAVPLLLERIPYGAMNNRARPAAVMALGGLGRLQQKAGRERIAEALIDRLRDPVQRVRASAMGALRVMGATQAIGALTAQRGPLSVQEQVSVDRTIRAIRSADEPKTAAVEKQLDELRVTVRKLKDTVETLEARTSPDADAAKKGKAGKKAKRAKKGKGKASKAKSDKTKKGKAK